MTHLEVHHREFRSHSGADSEENLITLCAACHARVHRR
jgi:5-methylcytosine-specific restriction endonuclease McrA